MCESGHLGPLLISIINFFLLNWSQVADQFKQPAMVEPLDPFMRRQLHSLEMAPGAALANDLVHLLLTPIALNFFAPGSFEDCAI